jgi:ribokinase
MNMGEKSLNIRREPESEARTPSSFRYRAMIGVGGIGAGSFLALWGDHTLGREESRRGRLLDRVDYCKLHIISHYVATLLGSEFKTIPVGKVGDDEVGKRLLAEMADAGLDIRYVNVSAGHQTLFSYCLVYPDGSGSNVTTDDSASAKVDAEFVTRTEPEFARFAGNGVALAAPEVPMEARRALLKLGTRHSFLRVASFTSGEIPEAIETGMLNEVDLVAANIDEAAAIVSVDSTRVPMEAIVEGAIVRLREINAGILATITAGASGSWSWDGRTLRHSPIVKAELVNAAGAGDAHLAGVIVGSVTGLPLFDAQQLGTLVAAMSVTSPHSIDKRIDRKSLMAFAERSGAGIPESVSQLLSTR